MSIRQYVAVKKSFKSLLHSAKCNMHFSKCTVPETAFSLLTSGLTTGHHRLRSKSGASLTNRPGPGSIN